MQKGASGICQMSGCPMSNDKCLMGNDYFSAGGGSVVEKRQERVLAALSCLGGRRYRSHFTADDVAAYVPSVSSTRSASRLNAVTGFEKNRVTNEHFRHSETWIVSSNMTPHFRSLCRKCRGRAVRA